ncbi:MAG TPA: aspartate/glutamate racemase family protein [Nitrosopumilaceae archaeon]|nr:aspartate/glutamate racemase family protein [Nitrosopumilaceae archaeon]
MPRIAVFDSGLGSLSIIKLLQKKIKSEIIYFADQKNFPYGTKSLSELENIIKSTISKLEKKFNPDIIIIGSNTPSLLLKKITKPKIIGVYPPLIQAVNKTKSHSIAILATKSVIESNELRNFIKKNVPKTITVNPINASALVELVESGKFIYDKKFCKKRIEGVLLKQITTNNIDVVTLSSTHLPFLLPILKQVFPNIIFLDPACLVADQVARKLKIKNSKRNSMKIFTSGNLKHFQKLLSKIGIENKVKPL